MKKLFIYLPCLLLIASTGCNKFLEKEPDNRAKLNSPEKVSQLLATAYPQANYQSFAESISDNVRDKGAGQIEFTNRDPYFFEDTRDNQQDSPEFYWNACYTAIAAANQALEAITQAPDQANYSTQKGEALLARAYAHFMLVTFFSKFYDPATAASALGIPYVTEPETIVVKTYERKTVAYVYEMIEKDLLAGLPLIKDETYTVPKYHFNRAAANAFAARFYLFKKDYPKVVQYSSVALPQSNIAASLRPWNTVYRTITYNEMWARYQSIVEPTNILLAETGSFWGRSYGYRYNLDANKRSEIILKTPVTGGTWSYTSQLYTAGTNNYLIPKINEYFVRVSVNAEIGNGYVMLPLFTLEEALFNRAEANTYLGKTTEAIADLNIFASTRITNYSPVTHNLTPAKILAYYNTSDLQAGLIRTILDFKRAEFVTEGMRWFDILRYKLPVEHEEVSGIQVIKTHTLAADDLRRVFQIPESAKISGLELNPR